MKYTYNELVDMMFEAGCNLADLAIGNMMDIVEEETGKFPNWDDVVEDWIVKKCIG